jgi:signal transduction histidine kinase
MLLRQIFENVITNGIKYSPSHAPITISVAEYGSTVRVTVADRGSGIAQEDLARVRHAYYRGPNSKGTSGAGLGLYVVERLVEAHHGRLAIESEVGRGTTVTIDLPLINVAATA